MPEPSLEYTLRPVVAEQIQRMPRLGPGLCWSGLRAEMDAEEADRRVGGSEGGDAPTAEVVA